MSNIQFCHIAPIALLSDVTKYNQLRRRIINEYSKNLELNGKSCEMLADDLYEILSTWYPNKDIRIDVSEEGINGAYVEYEVTDDE